jgi:hypothetical protein
VDGGETLEIGETLESILRCLGETLWPHSQVHVALTLETL